MDISIGILNGEYLAVCIFNISNKNNGSNLGYIRLEKDQHRIYLSNVSSV